MAKGYFGFKYVRKFVEQLALHAAGIWEGVGEVLFREHVGQGTVAVFHGSIPSNVFIVDSKELWQKWFSRTLDGRILTTIYPCVGYDPVWCMFTPMVDFSPVLRLSIDYAGTFRIRSRT